MCSVSGDAGGRRGKTSVYKLNFDLYRAGGLWLWVMLFVLAWSSVAFNLKVVYYPVMQTVFTLKPDQEEVIPSIARYTGRPRFYLGS